MVEMSLEPDITKSNVLTHKEKAIHISEIRNRIMNCKPQYPCSHCGSKWHSIFVCTEYHKPYHNNYEPLPKFYSIANSNKFTSSTVKHISININSDKTNSDSTNTNGVGVKRKSSAAFANKNSRKRIQQVWILKSSN